MVQKKGEHQLIFHVFYKTPEKNPTCFNYLVTILSYFSWLKIVQNER